VFGIPVAVATRLMVDHSLVVTLTGSAVTLAAVQM
jgi:hypothetical protein